MWQKMGLKPSSAGKVIGFLQNPSDFLQLGWRGQIIPTFDTLFPFYLLDAYSSVDYKFSLPLKPHSI